MNPNFFLQVSVNLVERHRDATRRRHDAHNKILSRPIDDVDNRPYVSNRPNKVNAAAVAAGEPGQGQVLMTLEAFREQLAAVSAQQGNMDATMWNQSNAIEILCHMIGAVGQLLREEMGREGTVKGG